MLKGHTTHKRINLSEIMFYMVVKLTTVYTVLFWGFTHFYTSGELYLCNVFQNRRMTEVRYGLVIGFLWVQLMSCKIS